MWTKWERWAPLSGVLAVALWVVGAIILWSKATGDKGPKILASYQHHENAILLGGFLWCLGVIFFIWFLGSLRIRLLAAEGPAGRLTALAYGGGIAAATAAVLMPGGDMAAVLHKDDIDASAASALHRLSDGFFIGTEYVLPVMFFACAIAALRYAAMPRWLGWINALIGLVLLIGPIGWAALIFATPIWVLIVSIWLYTTTEAPSAIGAPAAGTT